MNESPIRLTEYTPHRFHRDAISLEIGEMLWRKYGGQVAVEFPSPKTDGRWQLTSQGWVGFIPLTPEVSISLPPKVELKNLFGMLEYAYRMKIRFLEGLWDSNSLEEFYERLANILAHRILDRGRRGFFREYIPRHERSEFIRGRMDLPATVRRPWDTRIRCHYEEHTPDIPENQILAWTLSRIARSGICSERVQPTVRRAYGALQGSVVLEPYGLDSCVC